MTGGGCGKRFGLEGANGAFNGDPEPSALSEGKVHAITKRFLPVTEKINRILLRNQLYLPDFTSFCFVLFCFSAKQLVVEGKCLPPGNMQSAPFMSAFALTRSVSVVGELA